MSIQFPRSRLKLDAPLAITETSTYPLIALSLDAPQASANICVDSAESFLGLSAIERMPLLATFVAVTQQGAGRHCESAMTRDARQPNR